LNSNDPRTLLEIVGVYVGSLKESDEATHKELYRFVNWCGPERQFTQMVPSLIGGYADSVAGTGTTPLAAERLQVVRKFLTYARKKGIIEVNLAQHVRVRKARTRKVLGGNLIDNEQVELTSQGHKQLVKQLAELKSQRAPLALDIQKAAADKDVRENSPLEAAREQLGQVEGRIREIEGTLIKAIVIDESGKSKSLTVRRGNAIVVQDIKSGKKFKYTVVDASEANALESKISDVSPLGKVFLGQQAGQQVVAETPRGVVKYKIVEIN
jgi:transcription elongation factor GreA